jgi:REP element-mobilizing transposase RayT
MEQLDLRRRAWGGKRDGAGRPPKTGRRSVPHARRSQHVPRCPAHVTLRAAADVPSLRSERLLAVFHSAFRAANSDRFRLLAFSVQKNHLYLVVEADEPTGFVRGVQGLAIRVAKAVNRALGRRGSVWAERYHSHLLKTPSEVRSALVYVINNLRKHVRAAAGLDPYSSARWFDGWTIALDRVDIAPPVVAARTWLARIGWRRFGLIDPEEAPRPPLIRQGRRRR